MAMGAATGAEKGAGFNGMKPIFATKHRTNSADIEKGRHAPP
jgi:hypothetical protein